MEILKNILEFGDIPPRFVFVILATNISNADYNIAYQS